jgi:cation transport ATPase
MNVFELGIKGMKCSNCSNKVETKLKELENIKSANVNLITEKALVSFQKNISGEEMIKTIKEGLEKLGFTVHSVNDLSKSSANNRILMLDKLNFNEKEPMLISKLMEKGMKVEGVCKMIFDEGDGRMKVEYDPGVVKGRQLFDSLNELYADLLALSNKETLSHVEGNNSVDLKINQNKELSYINVFNSSLKEINSFKTTIDFRSFLICCIATALLVTMTMLLPDSLVHMLNNCSLFLSRKCSLFLIITLFLSVLIIAKYGVPIYKRSLKAYISSRHVNMDTLITLGSLSSILLTIFNLVRLFSYTGDMVDMQILMVVHAIEAAATVVSISTIGKYVEEKAKNNIRKQTKSSFSKIKLADSGMENKVTWIKPRNKKFLALQEKIYDMGLLEKEDLARITEGQFMLCDCIVMFGEVEINENISFGQETLIKKTQGDKIKSGSVIKSGSCVVMVEEVLEESLLYKLTKEMSSSLNQKLNFQNFINRVIRIFVPTIILIAVIATFTWLIIYFIYADTSRKYSYLTLEFVIERGISILVVSCPCAFGLAIPSVTTIIMSKAVEYGILIKNLSILPEMRLTNCIVFDKTGTLTEVIQEAKEEFISSTSNRSEESSIPLYEMIAFVEKSQKHPIAEVIYSYTIKKSFSQTSLDAMFSLKEAIEVASHGIEASVTLNSNKRTHRIMIGNYKFIKERCDNGAMYSEIQEKYSELIKKKLNVIFVCVDREVKIIFSIDSNSEVRREAKSVISYLITKLKMDVYILSGDNSESVKSLGMSLGMNTENCIGDADNMKKKQFLNELRFKLGRKVLMIGDGINDILSLSEADFGISFNSNSHLNLVASDVIFVKLDLTSLITLMKLSKVTYIFIWLNIFWAFSYNLVMLPITAGVFHYWWKFDMSPTVSSFSMLCSSFLILLTANMLKFINFSKIKNINKFRTRKETDSSLSLVKIMPSSRKNSAKTDDVDYIHIESETKRNPPLLSTEG